jgi:short-subunit dehydrogenase
MGRKVLITGGANGIGYELAWLFAVNKDHVILVDNDAEALWKARKNLLDAKLSVKAFCLDIRHDMQVANLVTEIGDVDILINNAGIGHHATLADTNLQEFKHLMDVNFWGALNMIYELLPSFMEKKSGHIVNVSSGQSFFKLPTWGAYTCTKIALAAFSEVLHFELRKFGINVTTVYPFMVNTGFYDYVETKSLGAKLSMTLLPFYSMTPEKTARVIYKAIDKKKKVDMVSSLNTIGKLANSSSIINSIIGRVSNWALSK